MIMMANQNSLMDDEMNFFMRKLFHEVYSIPTSNFLKENNMVISLPNLPLVLYQKLVSFISNLVKE